MTLDELAKKHGVASLELSKKLEKVGMPQKSLWYWQRQYFEAQKTGNFLTYSPVGNSREVYKLKNSFYDGGEYYAAFHATELADILPDSITEYFPDKMTDICFLQITKEDNKWFVNYISEISKNTFPNIPDTLPNALAKMVLYLLDKGIIKK